jgi:type II secretory pathway component HofQ
MHPVTRLGRVVQQLRSFGELHANELDLMAAELEAAGATDVAQRLRDYRDLQRDEAQLVVDELVDLRADMQVAAVESETPGDPAAGSAGDPAVNSPRRARWLADQAAEAERLREPISRRGLFGRVAPTKPEHEM